MCRAGSPANLPRLEILCRAKCYPEAAEHRAARQTTTSSRRPRLYRKTKRLIVHLRWLKKGRRALTRRTHSQASGSSAGRTRNRADKSDRPPAFEEAHSSIDSRQKRTTPPRPQQRESGVSRLTAPRTVQVLFFGKTVRQSGGTLPICHVPRALQIVWGKVRFAAAQATSTRRINVR